MTSNKKTKLLRTDEAFYEAIRKVQAAQQFKRKNLKPIPSSKITKAITKHKAWPFMLDALLQENWENEI